MMLDLVSSFLLKRRSVTQKDRRGGNKKVRPKKGKPTFSRRFSTREIADELEIGRDFSRAGQPPEGRQNLNARPQVRLKGALCD